MWCKSNSCRKSGILFLSQILLSISLFLPFLMALAKDRSRENPQVHTLYGAGGSSLIQSLDHPPSLELFGYKNHVSLFLEEDESSDSQGSYSGSLLPIHSDASNYSSSSYVLGTPSSPPQEAQAASCKEMAMAPLEQWGYSAVLSFKQGDRMPCASYLSLDAEDESSPWMNAMDQSYQLDSRLILEHSCSTMGITNGGLKNKRHSEEQFGFLYSGANIVNGHQESTGAKNLHSRPQVGSDLIQSPKRQCLSNRKSKDRPSQSKDPQSIAAKNRRERISERLKVLQELVPNGTKVDLITMLEKAISYVKFLQLQVKVLATDEFWPAQGGKAPELSQVKEAIDAILASQRDRDPSSRQ